jgi:hypothetical protein
MFDETNKYKNSGNFFFEKGDQLSEVSKQVPEEPGVYYILKLAKGKVELVYIGKSGTLQQNGTFKNELLKKRLNNKQDGVTRQAYFEAKIKEESIDALDIYWFVTHDKTHKDLPGYVEGVLLQQFYNFNGCLPSWNKAF